MKISITVGSEYTCVTSRKASLSALNPGKFRSLLYNKVQVQTVYLYILEVLDQLRFPLKPVVLLRCPGPSFVVHFEVKRVKPQKIPVIDLLLLKIF
jgi:hypothetical protein